jgi:DNA-binding response OmpR family regulator
MTHASILLVDDDRELDQMLTEYLSAEAFRVAVAVTGTEALERLAVEVFDLVILDVMLPSLSGFDVLRRLRRTIATPVIMLTARGEDVDRILGLELGADDYLPKPFNPRELVARIHAVLRRTAPSAEHSDQMGHHGSVIHQLCYLWGLDLRAPGTADRHRIPCARAAHACSRASPITSASHQTRTWTKTISLRPEY